MSYALIDQKMPKDTTLLQGGLKGRMLLTEIDNLKTIAVPKDSVIADNHIFVDGKNFHEIEFNTFKENTLTAAPTSEEPGAAIKNELSFFLGGATDEAVQFFNNIGGKRLLVLVEMENGEIFQFGKDGSPAYIIPTAVDPGTLSGGGSFNTSYKMTSYGNLVKYKGAIQLTPAKG